MITIITPMDLNLNVDMPWMKEEEVVEDDDE